MRTSMSLSRTIYFVSIGYIFFYTNLTLSIQHHVFNFFPSYVGYVLTLCMLGRLAQELPVFSSLRPIGWLLAIWDALLWLCDLLGVTVGLPLFTVIAYVLHVYFQHQLLTHLSALAQKYQSPDCIPLRHGRTVLTGCLTANLLFHQFSPSTTSNPINILLLLVLLSTAVYIWRHLKTLYEFLDGQSL